MKSSSLSDRIFDIANIVIMVIIVVVTLYPFWFSIVGSFSEGFTYMRSGAMLWPEKFTTVNYLAVFRDKVIYNALYITIARTIIGTIAVLFVTSLAAYAISRKSLKGRGLYTKIMLFTMYFDGGFIPLYLLLKGLNLIDNFLVYIIPLMFNVWYMIIIHSSLREMPDSLIECARIDGAKEYSIFFRIILPLSKPVLAAVALFASVQHWNSYYDSLMFTNSDSMQTIQLYLMKVITNITEADAMGRRVSVDIPEGAVKITPETVKFATMVVTSLPIIAFYPFIQKYFVKGVMIGAIKG